MNIKTLNVSENQVSKDIIGCALCIHKMLGPGLLESVYDATLAFELRALGYDVQCQYPMSLLYNELDVGVGFRADILVEGKVIVEVKSIEKLAPIHFAQTLTYLRLTGIKLGLLINFNSMLLKDGIRRIVNNL